MRWRANPLIRFGMSYVRYLGEFQLFYTKTHRCFIVVVVVVVSLVVALVVVLVTVLMMCTLLLFENINDAVNKTRPLGMFKTDRKR